MVGEKKRPFLPEMYCYINTWFCYICSSRLCECPLYYGHSVICARLQGISP